MTKKIGLVVSVSLFVMVQCDHRRGESPTSTEPSSEQFAPVAADPSAGRFVDNGDGTVTDSQTGLMWAAKDNGSNITWDDATRYCDNLTTGGHSDWRMPTREELATLYDARFPSTAECGIPIHLTPAIRLSCWWVWSSETPDPTAAWIFSFGDGLTAPHGRSGSYYDRALPVRSR